MSPDTLLLGGFFAVVLVAGARELVGSSATTLRWRLRDTARQVVWVVFLFTVTLRGVTALARPALGLVAERAGYVTRRDLNASQRLTLTRVVTLDEELSEAPVADDPEARAAQAARRADVVKERARLWRQFEGVNGRRLVPEGITLAVEYLIVAVPIALLLASQLWTGRARVLRRAEGEEGEARAAVR